MMSLILRTLLLLTCLLGVVKADVGYEEINEALKPDYDHYKLPTAIRPQSYRLTVVTHLEDPENLYFIADVIIKLRIMEDTQNITLHSQNLTIDATKILLKNTSPDAMIANSVRAVQVIPKHDYYVMHLTELLRKGEIYLLTIPFQAPLNQKQRGYYRSSYFDKESNKTRWLSITQFEPAAARAAFPCFDEPQMKAKFTVVLGHHKSYTALSNMKLREMRPIKGEQDWVWSEFVESVPMSTYLVAYTINDFAYAKVQTKLKNDVQFRTWARRDAIGQCEYAGEVGPKVLQFYEDIFHIKFPLEKIDQIAIPDLGPNAMENWGLVTYRENALLYAANVSSMANKQRVASMIAHELAHQWFGNLVTMKWWTDLWLKEGLATYIASLGVEYISPEWKSLESESVDNTLAIFRLDALKSSHPVSQPIEHASQIFEVFDSISYKKGSAVLRMMHMFLGDPSFRMGIYHYLKQHAYDNAEQDNLWAAFTQWAHKYLSIPQSFDIKRIMDSWTLQTGYPVITVTRDYKTQTAKITQERYLLDTQASRTEPRNCWWVPLSFTDKSGSDFEMTTPRDWLECDDHQAPVPKTLIEMPNGNEWIIFNVKMAGLYRVKYDDHNWNMLIETLRSDNFANIHIINRAQLIDDALSLAWSGDQDYDVAMRLIEYLMREKEYIPWKAALENLGNVNRIMRQTPEYELFKKYMRKILRPIYIYMHGINDTKTSEENHTSMLHKVLIAEWACQFEVEDCIPRAQEYFKEWRQSSTPDDVNPIPTDLRSVVYCTAMRSGTEEDWQFLWTRYKNSNVGAEQKTIISALGCSRETSVLQRYLEWAFDESHIRKQDSFFAFGSVALGEIGYRLARDYFITNIQFLHDYYAPDSSHLSRLLTPLASQMITLRQYIGFKNFVDEYKDLLMKAGQSVQRALETIQINAQWKERNYEKYMRKILRPIYIYMHGINDTKTSEENHTSMLHKVLIAEWACQFEVEDCIPRAREYFKEWRQSSTPDDDNPIPTDLRSVVYCTAMRSGTEEDWQFLWTRYKNSNVGAEKKTIISALGCSLETWVLQRYLEWAFDETSHIRKQDSFDAFGSVALGEIGYHLARDYFLYNIQFLHDYYEPDSTYLAHLLTAVVSQMITQREYISIKNFVDENKDLFKKAEQGVQLALEIIQINAQWKERNYDVITARLRARV